MQLTYKLTTAFMVLTLLATGLMFTAPTASAHGDDHEHEKKMMSSEDRIILMEQMVRLLAELSELLQEKVEMKADMSHDDDHMDAAHHEEMMDEELKIEIMEHDGVPHVHIHEPGEDEVTFFLDDLTIDQEGEIVDAIVVQTDFTKEEVEAAATFPAEAHEEHGHDEHAEDEVHESYAGMEGLDGIHIMADGSVMLGTGETVTDATVNADNMIVLGDGTEVEPTMDMR